MEVKMLDGETVKTTVTCSLHSLDKSVVEFWSSVRKNPPFVVGFDTEWMCSSVLSPLRTRDPRAKVALLKLCSLGAGNDNNKSSCLMINFNCCGSAIPDPLIEFFAVKDVKFVGVNILRDVKKLKREYGLEVKNVVDLIDLMPPKQGRFGVSHQGPEELPSWLIGGQYRTGGGARGCTCGGYDYDRVQYATSSVYNAVKLAQKLLEENH